MVGNARSFLSCGIMLLALGGSEQFLFRLKQVASLLEGSRIVVDSIAGSFIPAIEFDLSLAAKALGLLLQVRGVGKAAEAIATLRSRNLRLAGSRVTGNYR